MVRAKGPQGGCGEATRHLKQRPVNRGRVRVKIAERILTGDAIKRVLEKGREQGVVRGRLSVGKWNDQARQKMAIDRRPSGLECEGPECEVSSLEC